MTDHTHRTYCVTAFFARVVLRNQSLKEQITGHQRNKSQVPQRASHKSPKNQITSHNITILSQIIKWAYPYVFVSAPSSSRWGAINNIFLLLLLKITQGTSHKLLKEQVKSLKKRVKNHCRYKSQVTEGTSHKIFKEHVTSHRRNESQSTEGTGHKSLKEHVTSHRRNESQITEGTSHKSLKEQVTKGTSRNALYYPHAREACLYGKIYSTVHNVFTCCVSMHGRCNAWPWMIEFSGVVRVVSRFLAWLIYRMCRS